MPNETLKELCQKFNSSADNVLRNNNKLDLYAGEWIKVNVNDFLTYIVKPVETLTDISKKFNVDKNKLMVDNNLTNERLFIGQNLKIYK